MCWQSDHKQLSAGDAGLAGKAGCLFCRKLLRNREKSGSPPCIGARYNA
jgi:hypothetical protein